MLMRKRFIPLGLAISASLPSLGYTADSKFCEYYARDLISVPYVSSNAMSLCQPDQKHWSTNKKSHIQWCLTATEAEANKKRYSHNKLVNLCNDTYKIVMIDRQRTAQLALSPDEEKKMQPLGQPLKDQLTTGKIKSPYQQLYPHISQAQKAGKLNNCDLKNLPIDLDNNPTTQEQVISTDLTCSVTPEKEHIWLVQSLNDKHRILFEGEDITLTIRYSEHNRYKNLAVATELPKQETTNKRCGAIKAEWRYVDGRYLPFSGKADTYGECLPPYNLPDTLQGENTLSMKKKDWVEGMAKEEQHRKTEIASFEEALSHYIPHWISEMEKKIPVFATPEHFLTPPKTEAKSSPEEKAPAEEPSLFDKIKALIGLE
ncbi:MAG: Unknown protein [uncultured Thiotrichaceae bacterium]|uniref:Uncharacterized protein n=1 Tax=uncultured Thiotrichaceae bacterium TaxID=298394 RepID=A0A6S6SKT8_9GAMM|nr:MAG: Unknown protein [uncultured Thiotrichaceae bacterium]